ncbi:MAG: type I phosphomannose isomerase catalytic subunit [Chthoniobacterales bacterium]
MPGSPGQAIQSRRDLRFDPVARTHLLQPKPWLRAPANRRRRFWWSGRSAGDVEKSRQTRITLGIERRSAQSTMLTDPLSFEPLFMERVWGGRRLETEYGKKLPPAVRIGESWEIVDRAEAQSVVHTGPLRGRTLHQLWMEDRDLLFGEIGNAPRFPLFLKLLDAREKLSVQVHPPAEVALELGGEPKTEFWYVARADPGAQIFAGLAEQSSQPQFAAVIAEARVANQLHRIAVKPGDAILLPSGRVHAIGAGNLIVEVQQNSDTTYRVFDWNRLGADGPARELHVEQSLRCIDFADIEPELLQPEGESLVRHELFQVEKWEINGERAALSGDASFAIFCCLSGEVRCSGMSAKPGSFFIVPACLPNVPLRPAAGDTSVLRITAGR